MQQIVTVLEPLQKYRTGAFPVSTLERKSLNGIKICCLE
jgi:hypothetical protein